MSKIVSEYGQEIPELTHFIKPHFSQFSGVDPINYFPRISYYSVNTKFIQTTSKEYLIDTGATSVKW